MKTRFYFTLIFFLFFPIVFLSAQEVRFPDEISKTDAIKIVEKKIIKSNQEISYFISKDTIPANTKIKTVDQPVLSPDYTSWFIFIDDEPFANWGHKCRYVFVNVKTGQYTVLEQKLPPDMDMMEPIKELIIKKTQKTAVEKKTDNEGSELYSVKRAASTNNNDNYAVIISGGMAPYDNWVRFWNDCSQIYKTLVNVYGYPDDHIYVLMSDGTNPANDRHLNDGSYDSSPLDLDGDGDNDVQYAATKANISYVFDQLSNTLNSNNNLFIFTTDHGNQVSGCDVNIILWGETMSDSEFTAEVDKVNAGHIIVVMEQCHSGGFIDNLQGYNRVIATACNCSEPSSAMPPDYNYDEFVYYWTSAVAGETPDGTPVDADVNNDDFVSMSEAFNYASAHDTRPETPQYSSTPSDLGNYLSLYGLFPLLTITGPSTVCTTNSTFTLNNRPSGTTVNWINSSNLTYISGQGTDNYTVQAANSSVSGMGWVKAIVSSSYGNDTIEKDVWMGKPAQSTITGNSEIGCEHNLYFANPGFSNSYNSVQWSVAGPLRIVGPSGGIHCTVQGTKSGMGWIYFTTTNTCGSSRAELLVEVNCWGFNVYPNPASSILTIESEQNDLEKTDNTGIKEVSLYDKMMRLLLHKQFKGKSTTLNVSRLKPDVYLLKIKAGDKTFDKKITVSRK